jgi:uncharacterized protein
VPLVYFDSSALVKLLTEEPGSDLAAELWDGCDAALSSRLAYPEVCAALAAADRNHDLTEHELDIAGQTWGEYWAAIRPVELTAAVEQHAGQLARSLALRAAEAVTSPALSPSATTAWSWRSGIAAYTPEPGQPASG